MDGILSGVARFRCDVFPSQQETYQALARDGQAPQALMISCSDSRVPPELITQCGPGDLFVCRNAGNIVPPDAQPAGGVSATIEYAIAALKIRHIVVMGHSDCGAMKGLLKPELVAGAPNVASWLAHGRAACEVAHQVYPADLALADKVAALAQENVAQQLVHLQTHPSVARALAAGELTLHGWFFDIRTGDILALDGETDRFVRLEPEAPVCAVKPSTAPRAKLRDPLLMAAE